MGRDGHRTIGEAHRHLGALDELGQCAIGSDEVTADSTIGALGLVFRDDPCGLGLKSTKCAIENARNADLAGACRPFASRQIILQLNQKIRDKSNRLLATIKTLSSGKQEIRDPSNHLLGT